MSKENTVTVCDSCLRASCWMGEFMCDDSKTAGTTERTIDELRELGREHESWFNPPDRLVEREAYSE